MTPRMEVLPQPVIYLKHEYLVVQGLTLITGTLEMANSSPVARSPKEKIGHGFSTHTRIREDTLVPLLSQTLQVKPYLTVYHHSLLPHHQQKVSQQQLM